MWFWSCNLNVKGIQRLWTCLPEPLWIGEFSSLDWSIFASPIITKEIQRNSNNFVGVVLNAPAIPKQLSLYTLPNLSIAIACFMFGHQTKDAYVIMALTTIVYSQHIIFCFSQMFFSAAKLWNKIIILQNNLLIRKIFFLWEYVKSVTNKIHLLNLNYWEE